MLPENILIKKIKSSKNEIIIETEYEGKQLEFFRYCDFN